MDDRRRHGPGGSTLQNREGPCFHWSAPSFSFLPRKPGRGTAAETLPHRSRRNCTPPPQRHPRVLPRRRSSKTHRRRVGATRWKAPVPTDDARELFEFINNGSASVGAELTGGKAERVRDILWNAYDLRFRPEFGASGLQSSLDRSIRR